MKALGILVLCVTLCQGFSGVQYVYKFNADIRTGATRPEPYSSVFVIKSDLQIQLQQRADDYADVYYQFINPQIFDGNGPAPLEGNLGAVFDNYEYYNFSRAEITTYFTKPFYAVLHKGLTNEFFTETDDEPSWIRNFKRSIVTTLQIDETHFVFDEVIKSENFGVTTNETTSYGDCSVNYAFVRDYPNEDDYYIKKHFDPRKCSAYTTFDTSSTAKTKCESAMPDDDQYNQSVERAYYFANRSQIAYKIESTGTVLYYPFRSAGEYYYSSANQTYVRDSEVEVTEENALKSGTFIHKYSLHMETLKTEKEILENIAYTFYADYFPEYTTNFDICVNGIREIVANNSQSQVSRYLLYKFAFFTYDDYEKCHKELYSNTAIKALDIFYHFVSNVGTRDSILYVKNILKHHKISSEFAVKVVQELPFSTIYPRQEILDDLQDLVYDKDFPLKHNVKKSAILAYGTFVYFAFNHVADKTPADKYAKHYYEQLTTVETYEEQLTWLHGLRNIEHGIVFDYLRSIVKHKVKYAVEIDTNGLREQAIWGLEKYIENHRQEVYDIVWPIVIDPHEDLPHRIAALNIYVSGFHTVSDIESVFWFMQYSHNPHFYHYFVTLIKSYQTSQNHCNSILGHFADDIEIYSQNFGSDVSTQFYSYEEFNDYYRIGGHISGNIIADNVTNYYNSLSFKYEAYIGENKYNSEAFYFKFGNSFENCIHLLRELFSGDLESLKGLTEFIPTIEYVTFNSGRAVFVEYADKTQKKVGTKKEAVSVNDYLKSKQDTFYSLKTMYDSDFLIYSDIGLPVSISFHHPMIIGFDRNISLGAANNALSLEFSIVLREDVYGHYGLRLFNPYSQTYTGVIRNFEYSLSLPIHFAIVKSAANDITLEFDYDFYRNESFGYVASANTRVFLEHLYDTEFLSKTSKSAKYYNVERTGDYKETSDTTHALHEDLGTQFNIISTIENFPESEYDMDWSNSEFAHKIVGEPWQKLAIVFHNSLIGFLIKPDAVSVNTRYSFVEDEDYSIKKLKVNFDFDFYTYNETTPWVTPSITTKYLTNITIERNDVTKNTFWEIDVAWTNGEGEFIHEVVLKAFRKVDNLPYFFTYYLDVEKSVTDVDAEGYFKFSQGTNFIRAVAAEDDTFLTVTWTGAKSSEQIEKDLENHFTYKSCASHSNYLSKKNPVTYNCIYDLTSLRSYVYNVDYSVASDLADNFQDFWDSFISRYVTAVDHYDNDVAGAFIVEVSYPIGYSRGYSDVLIKFPHHSELLSDFYHGNTLIDYDSTQISQQFDSLKRLGLTSRCFIDEFASETTNITNYNRMLELQSGKWTTLLEPKNTTELTWGLYGYISKYGLDLKFKLYDSFVTVQVNRELFKEGSVEHRIIFDKDFYENHNTDSDFTADDKLRPSIIQFRNKVIISVKELAFYAVYEDNEILIEYVGGTELYSGSCIDPIIPKKE